MIARGQRAERAVRRGQGRAVADRQGRRTSSTSITTQGRLLDAEEFENIIVRANPDGSTRAPEGRRARRAGLQGLRLHRPRATVKSATLVGIFLQPGANALEVAQERARATMRDSRSAISRGLELRRPVRHHALRRGVDPRSAVHARRGDGARVPRRVPVPAEAGARRSFRSLAVPVVAARHLRRPATCSATRSTR